MEKPVGKSVNVKGDKSGANKIEGQQGASWLSENHQGAHDHVVTGDSLLSKDVPEDKGSLVSS